MAERLTGKRVLVTGGGRGIGLAIAQAFADEGATCVITGRTTQTLEAAARTSGGRLFPVACDVSDDGSVRSMAIEAIRLTGGIDIVVNNAGIHVAGNFMDLAPSDFTDLFNVNVAGVVRVSQAFLPAMLERGAGRIINIASTAGLFESPGQSPYNTSKHGVVGLTRCLALEVADQGVTCNAICPGFVDTEMLDGFATITGADDIRQHLAARTPMGRILDPGEVASLAVYLASDESAGMTGQTMVISNGMRMH